MLRFERRQFANSNAEQHIYNLYAVSYFVYTYILYGTLLSLMAYMLKMGGVKKTKSMYPFFYMKRRNCSTIVLVVCSTIDLSRNWQLAYKHCIHSATLLRGEDKGTEYASMCANCQLSIRTRNDDNKNKSLAPSSFYKVIM